MLEKYLEDFYRFIKEIYIVETNLALLNWDRATGLKSEAKEFRAEQLSYFSNLYHNLKTNPKLIEIVENLLIHKNQLEEDDYHNLTIFKKDYSKSLKLTSKFVALKAEVCSKTESCWESVKMKSEFKTVEPLLQQVFDLVREEAELLGYENCAYDALLDNYEPGFTVQLGDELLIPMGKKIAEMLPEIIERQKMDVVEDKRILSMTKAKQKELIDKIAKIVNYNGIISESTHPFMTTIGPKDFRLTIKYELKNFTQTLSHGMHEMGHGLYEQGRLKNKIGSAMTRYDSFGIHESQARFYENIVGRSKSFLNNVAEFLLKTRSQKYSQYSKESLVGALFQELNRVNNNIIRIHADEVSYNQHVIIRYILEQKIVAGELRAKDLPEAWNSLYQEYLRISPRNEREGVLQDVHWFRGLVGYFPTYLVGNVYDGIILEEIQKEIPDFWQLISEGNFQSINNWLFEKIYKFGRRFSSVELIENMSGKKISSDAFLRYLNNKYLS